MATADSPLTREAYEQYAKRCHAGLRMTLDRIRAVLESSYPEDQTPIYSIQTRIKTYESALAKCANKGIEPTSKNIETSIRDIAGIRIVTYLQDEIYVIAGKIEKIPGINVSEIKDYVEQPKDSGYRSLHLIIYVEVYVNENVGSKIVPVEIQIRDILMNAWAAIEHRIRYKNPNPSPKAGTNFEIAATALNKFDLSILELQNSSGND